MKRAIQYLIALLIIAGIAYLAFTYVPQGSLIPAEATSTPVTATNVTIQTQTITAENDTYKIQVNYPHFGIANVDAVITKAVNAEVNTFKQYPANPPDSAAGKIELNGLFESAYAGSDIASVVLIFSEDTGGAHPNTAKIGINVNRATGTELTLSDALALTGKTLQQIADGSLSQVTAKIGTGEVFADGLTAKPENYAVFTVDKDNVTFIFNAYQAAPYSDGPQQAVFARVK